MAEDAATGVRRRYRSALRDEQAGATRLAIVTAARERFVANGVSATGMREVATAAGVAVETVYSHFSSKRGLLRAVIDAALVGDDAPVGMAGRPEFLAVGEGSRRSRIAAAARLLAVVHTRMAEVARLLEDGARSDPDLEQLRQEGAELRRRDTAAGFELLVGRAPSDTERDGLWAISSPEVFQLLVDGSGWSTEQYEAWMAAALERVLPRS